MWAIINLIFIGLVFYILWFWFRKYIGRNKPIEEQVVLNPFTPKKSGPTIERSKFFPDQLYVGKTVRLDPTMEFILDNLLFAFPSDPLIVQDFKYFSIDGNPFEEVGFEKIGPKSYIALYDKSEHSIYFLNRVMSATINPGEVPPMASQDVIELEENGNKYQYNDMSGLIEVSVTGNITRHDRLIRVYERAVNDQDSEYLICICDKPDVVDYYLGFNITINQLQDL